MRRNKVMKPALPTNYVKPKVFDDSAVLDGAIGSINRPHADPRFEAKLPKGQHALQLYSLATPNGVKVTTFLEEIGVEYDAYTIQIMQGEQFSSGFTDLNPNQKIPALYHYTKDHEKPVRVFESANIVLYLAEHFPEGRTYFPEVDRVEILNWVFWLQGVAPYIGGMFGHFFHYAPVEIEYAITRSTIELKRIYHVLDRHLEGKTWMISERLSIADFVVAPWFHAVPMNYKNSGEFAELHKYKNVEKWLARWRALPSVIRGQRVNGFGRDALVERHSKDDFSKASSL